MIDRITNTLSMACRYGGDVKRFYSVAEHTVHMVREAQKRGETSTVQQKIWLHDVPEWKTGDLLPIVKTDPSIAKAYAPIERGVMKQACADLGLDVSAGKYALTSPRVKFYDRAILAAEAVHVANPQEGWEPFDPEDVHHRAFGIRLAEADLLGADFKYWAFEMRREFERLFV